MTKEKKKARNRETAGKSPGRMSRKSYQKKLARLQRDLVLLQYWLKKSGHRVIVVFEGRDAAGKGGVIRSITERVSPRTFRSVALKKPSERERSQLYMQRYISHFPAAGEVVIFDRSWYNRAGVERVMGFCDREEYEDFLRSTPTTEMTIVNSGIQLIKYWLEVGMEKQEKRFHDRIEDARKVWKLSPMDLESYTRWYDYSRARDEMIQATDTEWAPWHIVHSNDKRRARLNCIAHLLNEIPWEPVDIPRPALDERDVAEAYDDEEALKGRRWIPERY